MRETDVLWCHIRARLHLSDSFLRMWDGEKYTGDFGAQLRLRNGAGLIVSVRTLIKSRAPVCVTTFDDPFPSALSFRPGKSFHNKQGEHT